ncbi:SIS domain-containing protein [Heyndrickxia coagulans]|jgi:glucoselysine-6-phosphate deglycase|uniref:SIS domain-containing protein n=1 Tax=Heyndrickxia TaxID=2837504 RepID=UPI0021B38B9F|nr:SIS domain-containing protein [Heyndrickxia coagulans]UXC22774.1 SIS domain-containing protein [Heyndrickxia coagulans]
MTATMMDYIQKEKETNLNIFNKRKELLAKFLDDVKQLNFNRIVVLATGSSSNAIESARYFVSNLLDMEVSIKMPFVVSNYDSFIDERALYFAVSQGGHSFSTIEAVKKIQKKSGRKVYTFTSDLESPIAKVSDFPIDIGCGKESVGFVTMGMSATVLIFILTGLELGLQIGKVTEEKYNEICKKILDTIYYTDEVIKLSNNWYEKNKAELVNGFKFSAIGYGSGFGVAKEAETKITETVRRPMVGYELEEYMHGPYLAVDQDSYMIFIDNHGQLKDRQDSLRQYMSAYTSHIFTIQIMGTEHSDDKTLNLNFETSEHLAALLLVIPIQILSYRLSGDIGIDLSIKIFSDFDAKLKSKI